MANTFTQIYLHAIFAVKYREAALLPTFREKVHAYLRAILREYGHIPVAVGGPDDHVHLLFSYNVNQPIPDLIRLLKANTSKMINANCYLLRKFEWQRGYAVFSCSNSKVMETVNYIQRQVEHHKSVSVQQELRAFLDLHGVEYDEKYLFEDI